MSLVQVCLQTRNLELFFFFALNKTSTHCPHFFILGEKMQQLLQIQTGSSATSAHFREGFISILTGERRILILQPTAVTYGCQYLSQTQAQRILAQWRPCSNVTQNSTLGKEGAHVLWCTNQRLLPSLRKCTRCRYRKVFPGYNCKCSQMNFRNVRKYFLKKCFKKQHTYFTHTQKFLPPKHQHQQKYTRHLQVHSKTRTLAALALTALFKKKKKVLGKFTEHFCARRSWEIEF